MPAASVKNPHEFGLLLKVNGKTRQQSSTRNLIFTIDALFAYLSQYLTLEAGDIIFTGTPEGVAQIHSGDNLEAELSTTEGEALVSLRVHVQ